MRFFPTILTALSLVALVGCGGSKTGVTPANTIRLGTTEFFSLDQTLRTAASEFTGTGRAVAVQPLVHKDRNFDLRFALQPGGKLTLVALSNAQLTNGVEVSFARTAGNLIEARIKQGTHDTDITRDLGVRGETITGAVRVEIDVHGQAPNHKHIAIWWNGGRQENFGWFDVLTGNNWGVVLDKATVTQAIPKNPRDTH